MPCTDFHLAKLLKSNIFVGSGTRIRKEGEMEDPSGPAAFMESEGVDVPPEPADDIPEDDWAEANEDGATGTEEEEGDAESYDTEDEDPIGDEVRPAIIAALAPLVAGPQYLCRDECNTLAGTLKSQKHGHWCWVHSHVKGRSIFLRSGQNVGPSNHS